MKSIITPWLVFAVFPLVSFGEVKLTYSYGGETITVEGFQLSRPYAFEGEEKRFLPLEGSWGLEISDEELWDNCYYPWSYKVSRIRKSYKELDDPDFFGFQLGPDEIPFSKRGKSNPDYAVSWDVSVFENSILVLGWVHQDRFTSIEVVPANQPIPVEVLNETFRQFRIRAENIKGFPVILFLGRNTLDLKETKKNFSPSNPDYLYRLASRGSSHDFLELGLSGKELSLVTVQDSYSLMHGAALYGNVDVLKYLVEVGGHQIKRGKFDPVLQSAIYGGRLESLKFLMLHEEDALRPFSSVRLQEQLKVLRSPRTTPYEQALVSGLLDIVDYLTGLDVRYLKYKGSWGNVIDIVIGAQDTDMYNLIVRKARDNDLELKPNYLFGKESHWLGIKLSMSCFNGNYELVDALMDYKMLDINKTEKDRPTFLRQAVLSGNPELVALVIRKGANVETTYGKSGNTLLHDASLEGHTSVIRILVESGLDVNSIDTQGRTPLYIAVLSRHSDAVHTLLDLGANPNIKPEKQPEAIWMAVVQDDRDSFKLLVEYGANVELETKLAMQLMEFAMSFNIPEAVEVALTQSLEPSFSLEGDVPGVWLADYYDADLCQDLLVSQGADPIAKPPWVFSAPDASINRLVNRKIAAIDYPKDLKSKYGEVIVRIQFVIDPHGNARFLRFLEALPRDVRLFVRNTVSQWSFEMPKARPDNTAYNITLDLSLQITHR